MIYSLKGEVTAIFEQEIALDVHDVGYLLTVSRPEDFRYGDQVLVYCHEIYTENDHYLVGFKDKANREAFLSLIGVKGIGPKTAIMALRETTPELLFKAIASNNTAYLKKLPGIGAKAASQIILDLKGHLASSDKKGNPRQFEEVRLALLELGFKGKEIDNALARVDGLNLNNQEILRQALKYLHKGE